MAPRGNQMLAGQLELAVMVSAKTDGDRGHFDLPARERLGIGGAGGQR